MLKENLGWSRLGTAAGPQYVWRLLTVTFILKGQLLRTVQLNKT